MSSKHIVYVYGTLRPGTNPVEYVEGQLFNLGWFPGIVLGLPGLVACERVEVNDLHVLDLYEGYNPDNLSSSLYIRRPYKDGWIYEYNYDYDLASVITCGDWLKFTGQEHGSNHHLLRKAA
jgi:gamma-glutamylcyclotransferase (GGCT)/AIG2-like uncharacterized protein YtfP